MKRFLTEDEENAIRMCHHDFGHMLPYRAAKAMGITGAELQKLLTSARKKAPQLFPILSGPQYQIWKNWSTIKKDIKFLRKHKFIPPDKSSPAQFDMVRHGSHIKEVF